MLTFLKKIFVWWNQETIGTKLHTFVFGKFVGKDELGNKYYENRKKTKRWVIYQSEIDASKIPADWYSWIHFMKNLHLRTRFVSRAIGFSNPKNNPTISRFR